MDKNAFKNDQDKNTTIKQEQGVMNNRSVPKPLMSLFESKFEGATVESNVNPSQVSTEFPVLTVTRPHDCLASQETLNNSTLSRGLSVSGFLNRPLWARSSIEEIEGDNLILNTPSLANIPRSPSRIIWFAIGDADDRNESHELWELERRSKIRARHGTPAPRISRSLDFEADMDIDGKGVRDFRFKPDLTGLEGAPAVVEEWDSLVRRARRYSLICGRTPTPFNRNYKEEEEKEMVVD